MKSVEPECGDGWWRGHDEDAGGAVEDGAEVAEGGEGVALGRHGARGRRELQTKSSSANLRLHIQGFQMLH